MTSIVSNMFDMVFTQAQLATLSPSIKAPYGLIDDGAVGIKDGRIVWVGPSDQAPKAKITHALGGALITPGLVDCHTHLVFAGNRADEFEARLEGVSYEDISRQGGGIMSTVRNTREASYDGLLDLARGRVARLKAEGVTSLEVKSGYGLDLECEIKMLKVAQGLRSELIDIETTFLGAHALPPEFDDADAYIAFLCDTLLPKANALGLVDGVDGFCETIGFTTQQIERLFIKATELNLPVKLHAEQLSDQKGARMAAGFKALSVDHIEYLQPEDVPAVKQAGTVAVLLPGAFYYMRETQLPPIEALRRHDVPMALATDFNPGTSPILSPLTILNMGCTLFRLTPEEALKGMTLNGAKALGRDREVGSIEVGKKADMAIWDVGHPSELCYWVGQAPLINRIYQGALDRA